MDSAQTLPHMDATVLQIPTEVSLTKKIYVVESLDPLDLLACIEHSRTLGAPRPGLDSEAKNSRSLGGHVEDLKELFARSVNDGTFTTCWTNEDRGRKFSRGRSLTTTKGVYRDLMTYKKYHDIDMINAQPTILCAICKFLGFECELLEGYLLNREATLAKIAEEEHLTRKEAKKRICSLINGGGLEVDLYAKEDEANRPSNSNSSSNSNITNSNTDTNSSISGVDNLIMEAKVSDWTRAFKKWSQQNLVRFKDLLHDFLPVKHKGTSRELRDRRHRFLSAGSLHKLLASAARKTAKDRLYSLIAQIMNFAEDAILTQALLYLGLEDHNVTRIIPAYDGFLAPIEFDVPSKIKDLNTYIARTTGFPVKFKQKEIIPVQKILEEWTKIRTSLESTRTQTKDVIKYVPPLIDSIRLGASTIILTTSMGSGKSTQIYKYINEHCKAQTVLAVCFRKSLSKEVASKITNSTHYLDSLGELFLESGSPVVVQVESLHRVIGLPDVLILDELSYSVQHILQRIRCESDTKDSLKLSLIQLDKTLKAAKVCIVSDALLQPFVKLGVRYARGSSLEFKPKERTSKGTLRLVAKDQLLLEITSAWELDKKVVIATNIKAFAKMIGELAEKHEKNVAVITADYNTDLAHNPQDWDRYEHGVIYSPVVSAGIDCTSKEFDCKFGYFSNLSADAYASVQSMGRVRYPKSSEVVICLETQATKYSMNPTLTQTSKVYQVWQERLERIASVIGASSCDSVKFSDQSFLGAVFQGFIYNEVSQKALFKEFFIQAMWKNGYDLVQEDFTNRETLKTLYSRESNYTLARIIDVMKREDGRGLDVCKSVETFKGILVEMFDLPDKSSMMDVLVAFHNWRKELDTSYYDFRNLCKQVLYGWAIGMSEATVTWYRMADLVDSSESLALQLEHWHNWYHGFDDSKEVDEAWNNSTPEEQFKARTLMALNVQSYNKNSIDLGELKSILYGYVTLMELKLHLDTTPDNTSMVAKVHRISRAITRAMLRECELEIDIRAVEKKYKKDIFENREPICIAARLEKLKSYCISDVLYLLRTDIMRLTSTRVVSQINTFYSANRALRHTYLQCKVKNQGSLVTRIHKGSAFTWQDEYFNPSTTHDGLELMLVNPKKLQVGVLGCIRKLMESKREIAKGKVPSAIEAYWGPITWHKLFLEVLGVDLLTYHVQTQLIRQLLYSHVRLEAKILEKLVIAKDFVLNPWCVENYSMLYKFVVDFNKSCIPCERCGKDVERQDFTIHQTNCRTGGDDRLTHCSRGCGCMFNSTEASTKHLEYCPIKECSYCGILTRDKHHEDHCLENRDKACKYCGLEFNKSELRSHELECAKVKTTCEHCHLSITNSKLEKHRTACTANTCNKVACSKCSKKFLKKYLSHHEAKCKGSRIACRHCKKLKYSTVLEEHELSCRERLVECKHCAKGLALKHLARHEAKCTGARVACRHCKKLKDPKALAVHELSCRERVVVCTCCSRDVRVKHLERHQAKCTGAKVTHKSPKKRCTTVVKKEVKPRDCSHEFRMECSYCSKMLTMEEMVDHASDCEKQELSSIRQQNLDLLDD